MMWKYQNDRRSENKSALLRQRAGSDASITMATPLPNVDGSRQQVAVAYGAELLDEFARYEALGEDPLSGRDDAAGQEGQGVGQTPAGQRAPRQASDADRRSAARPDTHGIQQLCSSKDGGGGVQPLGKAWAGGAGPSQGAVPPRQEGACHARACC